MESHSLLKILFPPPPSLLVNALSVVNLPAFVLIGLSELRGENMKYSKFSIKPIEKAGDKTSIAVKGKTGMFICYTPALMAGLASFFVFPNEGNVRLLILTSALALHFLKRLFEVLFVHKYSGTMELKTMLTISLGYFISTSTMIYAQHLSQGLAEPMIDLKQIGLAMFLIGISGNFYHHNLLSQLRGKEKGGEREYKIPKGGLFGLIICPHYLFEIIEYMGFFLISQTPHSLSVALGTMCYLVGRSCATRQWYISKFEDFPKHVKAIIPYVL